LKKKAENSASTYRARPQVLPEIATLQFAALYGFMAAASPGTAQRIP